MHHLKNSVPMNELHDYRILLNKADPNKEDSRLHGERYKVGTQSSKEYLMHVCQLPSTDVGPGDASGKRRPKAPVLAMLTFWWMRQKISVQGKMQASAVTCATNYTGSERTA